MGTERSAGLGRGPWGEWLEPRLEGMEAGRVGDRAWRVPRAQKRAFKIVLCKLISSVAPGLSRCVEREWQGKAIS